MNKPFVSVVVDTISARENCGTTPLPDFVSACLAAIDAQTYPRELRETIVVVDDRFVSVDELRKRYPSVRWAVTPSVNYFANKNAGAALTSRTQSKPRAPMPTAATLIAIRKVFRPSLLCLQSGREL